MFAAFASCGSVGAPVTAEGVTVDIGGGVSVQIEMSSEFGVEVGVNATAWMLLSYFASTALVLYPFAGVVAYLDGQ